MRTVITIQVNGSPAPQPRPRATRAGAHARVYNPSTADLWKTQVIEAAKSASITGETPISGGVWVVLCFRLARPKHHYRTGKRAQPGEVTNSAPWVPFVKPDIDNLAKSTLDALNVSAFWSDDAQVVCLEAKKRYAEYGEPTGCFITIGNAFISVNSGVEYREDNDFAPEHHNDRDR